MSNFEWRLNEALGDIPEVPDEEPVWNLERHIEEVKERDPFLEEVLLSSGDHVWAAIEYAKKFFRKVGWPELEGIVKNYAGPSYYYARDVIRRPFPEGEPAIARDAPLSYHYAKDVIKKGRFPEGEPAISHNPWWSYRYARYVVRGRFPEGEEAIYSVPGVASRYQKFLRKVGEA